MPGPASRSGSDSSTCVFQRTCEQRGDDPANRVIKFAFLLRLGRAHGKLRPSRRAAERYNSLRRRIAEVGASSDERSRIVTYKTSLFGMANTCSAY